MEKKFGIQIIFLTLVNFYQKDPIKRDVVIENLTSLQK